MKFSDPLSTMQYMGGTLSIHVALSVYCIQTYMTNLDAFNDCRSALSTKLGYGDIIIMLMAHLLGLLYFVIQYMIRHLNNGTHSYSYLQLTIKHFNITVYMLAFLYVHHKVYLPDIPLGDIFDACPPADWDDLTEP
jgi:hypothetical protein